MNSINLVLALFASSVGTGAPGPTSISCSVMTDRIINVAAATRGHMYADYKGRRYFFCCGACPGDFKKHPERYLANASIPVPKSSNGGAQPASYGIKTATIIGAYWIGEATPLPGWINSQHNGMDLIIWIKGSPDYSPVLLRDFYSRAGHEFLLKADGKPSVKLTVQNADFCDDHGQTQGYYAAVAPAERAKIELGVDYRLEPTNGGHASLWSLPKPILVKMTKRN